MRKARFRDFSPDPDASGDGKMLSVLSSGSQAFLYTKIHFANAQTMIIIHVSNYATFNMDY